VTQDTFDDSKADRPRDGMDPDSRDRGASGGPDRRKFDATDQRTLDGEGVSRTETYDRLPPLRILGQAHDTFLVAESAGGLVLVDQHAADERVQYERLRSALEADSTTQALASPVELSLTPDEAAVVDEYEEALARLGFHVDRDGRRLHVRTVPSVLGEQLAPDRLRDVFGTLLEDDETAADETVTALASELLADLACAPAITGNTSLTDGSIRELLAALDDCENPYACPHGRPTIVELGTEELEDRFERDYPGHGDRRE
jgi:DNA mismatch repair protein MutL